tara:strand:- start:599 stop:1246 length:648 start_codon:yes stop_codon:yes gene_type:complete
VKQKYKASLLVLLVSNFLLCQEVILQFQNGQTKQGEFIGTYMNHVHLLMGEDLLYFSCKDINKVLKVKPNQKFESFSYDCNENTVTADILFPPFLNPMTGEYETNIPDVFNSEIEFNQVKENRKESASKISEFEIKKLIRYAVKKEISKEREITNSYIQANQNKISKLELEIKNLKSRKANKNNSNSSFSSPRNHWELLTIGCIGYLAVLVMSSF